MVHYSVHKGRLFEDCSKRIDRSTVLGSGFIILCLRVDYSTITKKRFIILRLRLDHSNIMEKGSIILCSQKKSSLFYA